MRMGLAAACVVAALFFGAAEARAQAPRVGGAVDCNGNVGTIVRTEPRAGWDEPFYIVEVRTPMMTYEVKCLPPMMRGVAQAPAPAPARPMPVAPPQVVEARAPAQQVGGTVNCNGNIGVIVGTEPRPGWDEPFTLVRIPMGSGTYDLKCLSSHMKPVAGAAAAPNLPHQGTQNAATPAGNAQCRRGAKLEGLYGNNWYEVTVLAGPDASGWCPVQFDGYGPSSDRSVPELRPRGSGVITRPERPVPDGPPPGQAAGGAVPDGTYSCSKIEGGGGNYLHFGDATIRGGRVTGLGLPDGWTVRSVTRGAPNAWSTTVAEVTYQTRGGDTDKLECIPK